MILTSYSSYITTLSESIFKRIMSHNKNLWITFHLKPKLHLALSVLIFTVSSCIINDKYSIQSYNIHASESADSCHSVIEATELSVLFILSLYSYKLFRSFMQSKSACKIVTVSTKRSTINLLVSFDHLPLIPQGYIHLKMWQELSLF